MGVNVLGCVFGCLLRWTGNDRRAQLGVGREHAMEANQMQPRRRDECGQALHELQRRHHDMGGPVAVGTLELQHDLARAIALEPSVGNRRAGDIAAQVLQFLALIGAPAHRRMEAKAVRVDTQNFHEGMYDFYDESGMALLRQISMGSGIKWEPVEEPETEEP